MSSNPASTSTSGADSRHAKIATGLDYKVRGNEAFTKGDIKSALQQYHFAVLYLSGLENRSVLGLVGENSGDQGKPEDLSSDEDNDDDETQTPKAGSVEQSERELATVYSNMAACYLKQQKYARAIDAADKSLKSDSRNVKAKYRKAQALRLGGDLYKAKSYLEATIAALAAKRGKKEREAIESFSAELKAVDKVISEKEAMGRNKWKGFLGKNPRVFQVESSSTSHSDEVRDQSDGTKEEEEGRVAAQQ